MKTYFQFISLFFILFIIQSCQNKKDKELLAWKNQAKNVEIIRDNYGIAHIYGKTDADAVFGMLYAQCEDDFNRVEQNYIWAIGRLAEVEGEQAVFSDLRAQMFMTTKQAKENYNKSPEWLKKLCVAFADGINFYLYTHPEVKPKLINYFEPWMPMYFSEGSIGGDIERISIERIKAFYESKTALALNSEGNGLNNLSRFQEPQGSNGIAIAGNLTKSGKALLLINPHTSFYFRPEIHVVSEEGLNAYGAVTWGQFFVYQGFNEKTGWMHTSSYADVIDEYKEIIKDENGKKSYKYGTEWRPVDSSQVILKYKLENQLKEKIFTIYHTHHGPITQIIDNQWTATSLMWNPIKALNQSFTRTKQNGYQGFMEMMAIRTNSSNNTVYADAEGNIAYFHGNFMPIRNQKYDYTKPLDGSNPETDWQGLHTVAETINFLNPQNGWIQNCNSTPFTAAGKFSPKPENYPKYMSNDEENYRAIHAIELLSNQKDFTLDKLINLAYDPYLPAFKDLIPGLIQAYDKHQKAYKNLKEAIEVLRKWDFKTSETSVAMSLAHFYGMTYGKEGAKPEGLSMIKTFQYYGNQSPELERLEIFTKTVNQLTTDFGTWNTPWGEINRYQRLNGAIRQAFDDTKPSIPVGLASGTWGALAAFGANYTNNTKHIFGTRGNSFVAIVEFGDKVKAKSLLAGGNSGDPKSPHFNDQALAYSKGQFKEVYFYKESVLKHVESKYHPGN
ncbi:MAG: acylase [Flavobacteriaceae bacterium CG1_02_35_72]|nr:MAG: acylase [Flavobacteriaceae bacterium CG1_02_35_72]PJA05388.1 MAG: acylase [Flavobacteriales bacterium CG_4_10_14_0_2_um_filter_35_18]